MVALKRGNEKTAQVEPERARELVRAAYAKVATGADRCCGSANDVDVTALKIGYTNEDLVAAPEGANLGLGCGNPTAVAELRPGDVVIDFGSGAGFDAFLCARKVGPTGRVIGIDMTPEMIQKARANAEKIGARNVEFRLGFIEEPPVADNTADVVISNCVVNLSPDKPKVLREAFRVLKPGGRLRISDIVTRRPLDDDVREDARAYVACLAGAITLDDYRAYLQAAGFEEIEFRETVMRTIEDLLASDDPLVRDAMTKAPKLVAQADNFVSAKILARKPA
jgi:ubiquinone/menaquinone biosynthesis C-methylase UbiE